jgi:hypothetical protein
MKRQSNIKRGLRHVNAGENLTDKELYLVKAADAGSQLEVLLPTAITDVCLYAVEEGSTLDTDCVVRPLEAGDQIRLVAKGAGSAGDVLGLAAIAGSDAGKVRALPATGGYYFSPGIAEEDFVDGQEVKVRVLPRIVFVPTAFTLATVADTAATNSSPFGYSQAQADALVDNVREMRAALIAAGIMASN